MSRAPSSGWRRHWFTGSTAFDLAVLRIVLASWHFAVLAAPSAFEELAAFARRPASDYDGPWLLDLVTFGARPPFELVGLVHAVALVAAALAALGWRTRAAVATLAIAVHVLRGYEAGHPPLHHDGALPALALALLAFAPCGDDLSIDAARRSAPAPIDSWAHAWPPRLIGWLLAIAYGSAFASKIVSSGLGWADGASLQFYGFFRGLPHDRDLGLWLSRQPELSTVLSIALLAFEASFALAVLVPRLRWVYVPAAVALHALGDVALAADFGGFIALQAALVPWSRLRDAVRRLRERVHLLHPARGIPSPAHVVVERESERRGSPAEGGGRGTAARAPRR